MRTLFSSNSVVRNLQILFLFSTLILVLSISSAVFSITKLVESSELVNHTNEVLIESEHLMSTLRDAETSQRGFLLTHDRSFLTSYHQSKEKISTVVKRLGDYTLDNETQQNSIKEAERLITERFIQLDKVLAIYEKPNVQIENNPSVLHKEILEGKEIMDTLRRMINKIKNVEKNLLALRTKQQQKYTSFTPILVILAALISILITLFSYAKIKKELDARLKKEEEDKLTYKETSIRITNLEKVTKKIANGDHSAKSEDSTEDELGRISKALNLMSSALESNFKLLATQNWQQEGIVKIGAAMRGERDIKRLCSKLLNCITEHLDSPIATLYINEGGNLILSAAYGISHSAEQFFVGKSLIGQSAANKKIQILENIPPGFFIESSLGKSLPVCLLLVPLVHEHETIAIIEIGLLRKPNASELEFLTTTSEPMAIGINAALGYLKLQSLLEETQVQTEELQAQHTELEGLNAELETQTQKLQTSQKEIRAQQLELHQTNQELEERSGLLEEKNQEILKKAKELEISTRYKSEFLANMSHELRTPLNSILLLSRLLHENIDKNLSNDQIEYAHVIQSSGKGLLNLIDDILDLSKIEAGKMDLEFRDVALKDIADDMKRFFAALAKEKRLDFKVHLSPELPYSIQTDKLKLEQILKNLLANAFKFTPNGTVSFEIKKHASNNSLVYFVVKDTGIGIPENKQQLIFEAFQQADGSTRRKYGGTGLGLSICRELTKLLDGKLEVSSEVKKGSSFTLIIPIIHSEKTSISNESLPIHANLPVSESKSQFDNYVASYIPDAIPDDRTTILKQDNIILIVEDDTTFAKSLILACHKKGYKVICLVRGDEVYSMAKNYLPVGILLAIQLPIKSGWEVINELKKDNVTRHIPVHMMSSYKMKNDSLLSGASDFVNKPMVFEQIPGIFKKIEYVINRTNKKVLIIEDNPKHARALSYYLNTYKIISEVKNNIPDSLTALKKEGIDCVILEIGIPDAATYQLLEDGKKIAGLENLPVIIFTGNDLSASDEQRIGKYANTILVKSLNPYQRMLEEVSLFLNIINAKKKNTFQKNDFKKLGVLSEILKGKTVLLVDDDARNIFSLSKSLENINMKVITAINGKEALLKLEQYAQIDLVLLDMMMPEMDGYETAKLIRENNTWKTLPIIAVTAKAMPHDREKCIRAGANDYITKPIDIDQLLSLLRVWLYNKHS